MATGAGSKGEEMKMKIEISKSWLPWCGEIGLNLFVRWEKPWHIEIRLLVLEISIGESETADEE